MNEKSYLLIKRIEALIEIEHAKMSCKYIRGAENVAPMLEKKAKRIEKARQALEKIEKDLIQLAYN